MKSNIYTRGGDTGTTSLSDGSRVSKASLRVEVYGVLDEVNAWTGTALAFAKDDTLQRVLEFLAHKFYNCSSNLATPPGSSVTPPTITEDDVLFLERAIDHFEETSGKIQGFVLPGKSQLGGMLHIARTVCRRAERLMYVLARNENVEPILLKFVNRSSDLLFAAARYADKKEHGGDLLWSKDFAAPSL